jgi:hypothetical protein
LRKHAKLTSFSAISFPLMLALFRIFSLQAKTWGTPYAPPLLPVISCTINSALLYIMVARNRNTIWLSPAQLSLHRRAALTTNSNRTQSAHKGGGSR